MQYALDSRCRSINSVLSRVGNYNTQEAEAGGACHTLDSKQQRHGERAEERERARYFSGFTGMANRPKRYSVFNSRPSKVRVISTRPWTSSARRDE